MHDLLHLTGSSQQVPSDMSPARESRGATFGTAKRCSYVFVCEHVGVYLCVSMWGFNPSMQRIEGVKLVQDHQEQRHSPISATQCCTRTRTRTRTHKYTRTHALTHSSATYTRSHISHARAHTHTRTHHNPNGLLCMINDYVKRLSETIISGRQHTRATIVPRSTRSTDEGT
jgi:hypothetical protein